MGWERKRKTLLHHPQSHSRRQATTTLLTMLSLLDTGLTRSRSLTRRPIVRPRQRLSSFGKGRARQELLSSPRVSHSLGLALRARARLPPTLTPARHH